MHGESRKKDTFQFFIAHSGSTIPQKREMGLIVVFGGWQFLSTFADYKMGSSVE